jgi:hypothetical protein
VFRSKLLYDGWVLLLQAPFFSQSLSYSVLDQASSGSVDMDLCGMPCPDYLIRKGTRKAQGKLDRTRNTRCNVFLKIARCYYARSMTKRVMG